MILRKKVLVIEDNELNRTLLSEILSGEYQVLEAENGQVALDILKQHKDRLTGLYGKEFFYQKEREQCIGQGTDPRPGWRVT